MKRSIGQHTARRLAIGILSVLAVPVLQAQAIYRITGPDGRVTFSDQPPAPNGKTTVLGSGGRSDSSAASGALPFELRQIASRFPVTLYSGDSCPPCNNGRALLAGRGIPFAERTVTTPQDGEALQRLSGDTSLPFLMIGGQKIRGFLASDWTQYLDAAGYPASSQLPPGYRNPPPTPLVALPKPAPVEAGQGRSDTASPALEQPRPPASNPADNPAGITF